MAGNTPSSQPMYNRDIQACYSDMLDDDAVIAALNPLIDAVATPELILAAPCDPVLDQYLKLFKLYSGLGSIRREVVAEAMVYGAAVVSFEWRMLGGSSDCSGWVVPVDCRCLEGDKISFLKDGTGRVDGIRSGYKAVEADTFIFSNSVLASDHCGRSVLASVIPLWELKQEMYANYMNWMRLFSHPVVIATTGPDAEVVCEVVEVDGEEVEQVIFDPVDDLYEQVKNYTGGSVFALPHGTTFELLQPEGKSEEWLNAIEKIDQKIVRAITSQSLATHSSGANSRAAAEVHAGMITNAAKAQLKTFRRNIMQMVTKGIERSFTDPKTGCIDPKANIQCRMADIVAYWDNTDGNPEPDRVCPPDRHTDEKENTCGCDESKEVINFDTNIPA